MTVAQYNGGKMQFTPFNRHLVINVIEEEKKVDNSVIVLPSDYEKPLAPYVKAEVVSVAFDSKFYESLQVGDTIAIERRMLHKIEFEGESIYLILENYIFGRMN